MKNAKINGVTISGKGCKNRDIRSTITWIDIKISDFKEAVETDASYAQSQRAITDFHEIRGSLKTLRMLGTITGEEFNRIINRITGDESVEIAEVIDYVH